MTKCQRKLLSLTAPSAFHLLPYTFYPNVVNLRGFHVEPIAITIGIAIEIEKHDSANVLDPDPDSDFDPEKNALKVTTT
ncbi:MAG: hypothetical protein JRI93_03880 [Deltaproteobacteria bacterium]|nr:hypothetical protein [Deltaproteobacteria bacterium]